MHHNVDTILSLAIILFLSNIIRAISIKIKLPPVIGLIILGKIIGPSLLNIIELNTTIQWIAQIGVLFLIFSVGVQTDLKRLKEDSKKASFPAVGGILFPFLAGFLISYYFDHTLTSSLIIGVVFISASISVPLMTLIEIDKFSGIEGRCIVNTAIITDIFSIILISILFSISLNSGTYSVYYLGLLPLIKTTVFFVVTYLIGKYLIINIFANKKRMNLEHSILSLSVAIIFIYAWFAEYLGLEAVIGALLSGFFIGQTDSRHFIDSGISQVGKSFFVDVFFVSIGLSLNLKVLSIHPIFLVAFILLAIASKFIGCFAGAIISRFDYTRSLRIGVGLIPKGEVSLIIGAAAFQRGLISMDLLSAIIIMVVVTSILAPFLIKFSYITTKKETF